MSDEMVIEQKQSLRSTGTQIGQQNVYNGMTPEEASKLAIDLFMDNFPKLQQKAMNKVEERVSEFCNTVMKKLVEENVNNFSAFTEPDVQYMLYEAQNNYVRFGTEELLGNLSNLITQRIKYDSDEYLRIIIDKAISVVPYLSKNQIDALSLIFLTKNVKIGFITDISGAKEFLLLIDKVFKPCGIDGLSLLNTLGCLELNLGYTYDKFAETHSLDKTQIKEICPHSIMSLSSDYGTSHIGRMIAIMNMRGRIPWYFDLKTFIDNS